MEKKLVIEEEGEKEDNEKEEKEKMKINTRYHIWQYSSLVIMLKKTLGKIGLIGTEAWCGPR